MCKKLAIVIFGRTLMTLLNSLGILEIKAKPLLLSHYLAAFIYFHVGSEEVLLKLFWSF